MVNLSTEIKSSDKLLSMGRSLWASIPRESHAGWEPPEDRPDPAKSILESMKGRHSNQIVEKYRQMLQSPLAFFRGNSGIMLSDLAKTPTTGILVQSVGDCHLMNFGCCLSLEKEMLFDVCDFDETVPAPWEWDVKRLTTSFIIASHQNKISETAGRNIAKACAHSYRKHMQNYSSMNLLDMWQSKIPTADIVQEWGFEEAKKRFDRRIKKAAKKANADDDFPKLAAIKDGRGAIEDNPPFIFHSTDAEHTIDLSLVKQIFKNYYNSLSTDTKALLQHFEIHDFAENIPYYGNSGTYSGIILCMSADNEPLFLQIKEAHSSILEPYVEAFYNNQAQRIVTGQRLMQASPDIFLGYTDEISGHYYYIARLREIKVKPQIEILDEEAMKGFARLCGWALARAHARSGQAALISGYMGENTKFEDSISQFATEYAVQNEKDFESFCLAVKEVPNY